MGSVEALLKMGTMRQTKIGKSAGFVGSEHSTTISF